MTTPSQGTPPAQPNFVAKSTIIRNDIVPGMMIRWSCEQTGNVHEGLVCGVDRYWNMSAEVRSRFMTRLDLLPGHLPVEVLAWPSEQSFRDLLWTAHKEQVENLRSELLAVAENAINPNLTEAELGAIVRAVAEKFYHGAKPDAARKGEWEGCEVTMHEQAKPETPPASDLVEVLERLAKELNGLSCDSNKWALRCRAEKSTITAVEHVGRRHAYAWAERLVLAELDAARKAMGDG